MKNPKSERISSRMFWQTGAIIFLAVALGIVVNEIRSDRLPLVADWSVEAQLNVESGQNITISLDRAKGSFFSQKAVFLDSRPPEHYELGHIQGARNLPWEGVERYFDTVMADIPQDVLIITYCDGISCTWSKDLALELFFRGYDNVRVLVNGWSLWVEHQLPIDKGTVTSLER